MNDITHMFPQFPSYLTVIKHTDSNPVERSGDPFGKEGGTVKIVIHSMIHVEREITMPHSWSEGFVHTYPNKWLGDIGQFIIQTYGLTRDPVSYS